MRHHGRLRQRTLHSTGMLSLGLPTQIQQPCSSRVALISPTLCRHAAYPTLIVKEWFAEKKVEGVAFDLDEGSMQVAVIDLIGEDRNSVVAMPAIWHT
jgi:hypothetical protein